MRTTYDGYKIAERDLEMRGPGDFLHGADSQDIRQSGGVRVKLAQLCDDTGLLKAAFSEAEKLISSDTLSEHPLLLKRVNDMFTLDASVMN